MNFFASLDYRSASIQNRKTPYFSILIQVDHLYSEDITPIEVVPEFEKKQADGHDASSVSSKGSKTSKSSTSKGIKQTKRQQEQLVPSHCSIQKFANDLIIGLSRERGRLCLIFRKRTNKFQQVLNEAISDSKIIPSNLKCNDLDPINHVKKQLHRSYSKRSSIHSSTSLLSEMKKENSLMMDLAVGFLDSFISPLEFLRSNYSRMEFNIDPLTPSSTKQAICMLLLDSKHGLYYYSNDYFKKEEDPSAPTTTLTPVAFELLDGEYCIDNISECITNDWSQIEIPRLRKVAPTFAHVIKNPLPLKLKSSKLLSILQDVHAIPVRDLPNSTMSIEWEKKLSPIFVSNNFLYGTRSSILISMTVKDEVVSNCNVNQKNPIGAQIQGGFEKYEEKDFVYTPSLDSSIGRNLQNWREERNSSLYKSEMQFIQQSPSNAQEKDSHMQNADLPRVSLDTSYFQCIYDLDMEQTRSLQRNAQQNFTLLNEMNYPIPLQSHYYYHSFDFKGPQTNQKAIEPRVHLSINASQIERMKAMQIEFLPPQDRSKSRTRKRPLSRQSSFSSMRPSRPSSSVGVANRPTLSRSSSRLSLSRGK